MVNRELIEVFSEIAREKNVERSELASILEELFLYIIEREYGDSSNCSCIVNIDKGEIEIYSEKKIVEEEQEFIEDPSYEEAADMVEVIKAFCHLNNLEWEAVLGAAERKQEERGGFYQGIILQEVK